MKKSFKQWTCQELKKVFGVVQSDNFEPLATWINAAQTPLTGDEVAFLTQLLKKTN